MLIKAKRGFIKTIGKLQMVFISEGVLPKALGARKTGPGGATIVWLKLSQRVVSVFQGYFEKKNLNILGEQLVPDNENIRAQT